MYDLAVSDEKGYKEYGVTIDRIDYSHADWLKEAYEECLDMSKYLRRALDTHEESIPVRKVSDFLLEINAAIQASMGKSSTEIWLSIIFDTLLTFASGDILTSSLHDLNGARRFLTSLRGILSIFSFL